MPRIRHHVNPLNGAYLTIAAAPLPLPAHGDVEVELGSADARFLFERAAAGLARSCIGLEIRRDLVDDVNRRAAAAGMANLRAVHANINTDIDPLFPDARLARVFINFPDPWFKRRHHKRRVMTPEVAALVHRKLRPDGVLFFQSDVFELALEAMGAIEESELYRNEHGAWSFAPANPFAAKSLREVRCEERGLRIWRMLYRRAEAQAR